MIRVRRDPRCSSGTRPCCLLLHSILLPGRQQLCPGPAPLIQAALPAPLSARKSPAPATETGGAAKCLPAASELQDPSPAQAQQSLGGQLLAITALFKQRGGSLALHGPPLPSLPPCSHTYLGKSFSGQRAGAHVALAPAPALPSHPLWVSCRVHSLAPRGAAHPQACRNSAVSMGRAPKLQLENLAVDGEQSPVSGLRTKNASFPSEKPRL